MVLVDFQEKGIASWEDDVFHLILRSGYNFLYPMVL